MVTRAAKPESDDLLGATQTLYKVLAPLSPELRQRVLASVLSLLGISHRETDARVRFEAEPAMPRPAAASGRPLSPVELIQQKRPSTNAQRFAVFAYYRDKVEGQSRFARADLKAYFAKARVPPPQNYDRDFISAVQLGYIYEDGSDSYLTSRGVEAVEAGFEGKAEPRGMAKVKKAKAKRSPKR